MSFIRKIKKGNSVYLAEVEGYRENGKVKQRCIKYLGKQIGDKVFKKIYTTDVEVNGVKQYLDVLAIHRIAKEIGITNIIKNKNILLLIYTHLLDYQSIVKLEDRINNTDMLQLLDLKETSTTKLYDALTDLDEMDFSKIQDTIYNYLEKYEPKNKAMVIDVTDTYFEGNNINIKKRKGKESKVKKLLQIGLMTTFKYGFPIIHSNYDGNLSDICIFKDMILKLKKRKTKAIIMDRGLSSFENLKILLNLKIPVITGIRKNRKLIDDFILKTERKKIYNKECRIKLKNSTVYVKDYKYKNGNLLVIYNPKIEIVKNEIAFEKEQYDKIGQLGYSLIFYNVKKMKVQEIVSTYFEKDIIEKAFKKIKEVINLRPVRYWLKEHVRGHVKVCYIAYAILSLMEYKLKRSKKIEMSAIEALEKLKEGYKVELKDKTNNTKWDVVVSLKPKQKIIEKQLSVVYKN